MRQVLKGSTDVSVVIRIVDSTDGTPETGVVAATSGLDLKYWRRGAAAVSLTESDLSAHTDAHTDGGILHINGGLYRVDVPDAAFATGADTVTVCGTVTGMVVIPQVVQLVAFDPQSATSLGLTNLDTTVSSRASQASVDTVDDFLDTEVAAIKAKTDNLPSDPADASDIATSFAGVNTKLDTIDDFLDTEVAAIKTKTDNLPSDPADASDIAALLTTIAGYIDTEVAAIKAKTDNLPSDPADASDIAASFSTVNTTLATIAAYVDTEVAAIKAKTDNLPSDPADESSVQAAIAALATSLATLASYVDTEVAAIKAKTDSLTFTNAGQADVNVLRINNIELTGDGSITPIGPA